MNLVRTRFPGSMLVLILLVGATAGCGGDEDRTESRRGEKATPTSTATNPADGSTLTSGAGGLAASPSAPPPQATQGKPLEPQAVQPAAPGSYLYDETGTRTFGGCGPDGPPPSPSSFKVDPASGNRQQGVRDRRGSDGQGQVITTILEYRTDGVYLAYLKQEQQTPAGPAITEFEPNPPVLAMPAKPTQGQSWQFSMTSKDGKVKSDTTNTIEALEEEVGTGGGNVRATRVRRTTRATGQTILGAVDLTDNTVSWVGSRIVVKEVSDVSGTVGTCRIQSHIESVIRSTNPG